MKNCYFYSESYIHYAPPPKHFFLSDHLGWRFLQSSLPFRPPKNLQIRFFGFC